MNTQKNLDNLQKELDELQMITVGIEKIRADCNTEKNRDFLQIISNTVRNNYKNTYEQIKKERAKHLTKNNRCFKLIEF